jgi:hypothetical protein
VTGAKRRRRWLDVTLVGAVVGIAVAGIVVGIRHGSSQPAAGPKTTAPPRTETAPRGTGSLPGVVRLPPLLRRERGLLWWSAGRCRVASVDAASGVVQRFAPQACGLWPAPTGLAGVALVGGRLEAFEGRDGENREPLPDHPSAFLASGIAWRSDGGAFAYCLGTRRGFEVHVVQVPSGDRRRVADACQPAWLADGRLVFTRTSPSAIEAGGRRLLGPPQLARLLPRYPPRTVRAVALLAAGGHRVVASVVATDRGRTAATAGSIAVLAEDGSSVRDVPLAGHGAPDAVGLSPDGSAAWYRDLSGHVVVIRLADGRVRDPAGARSLAWSPSGRYVAAATDAGIVISTWPQGAQLAVVPVVASELAWTLAGASRLSVGRDCSECGRPRAIAS